MLPALVSALLLIAAPHVMAASPDPVRAALQTGADRLADLQNPDGGWFFVAGTSDCGTSCPNTIGVTALGLTAAYQVTHDPDHLAAAVLSADLLVTKQSLAPACDGNPATGADRPFTVDASFLTDISHIGRVDQIVGPEARKNYREVARAWFACVVSDFPSPAARADNRIDGRIAQGLSNLGAWDASLDIRAAMDVEERGYAQAEALQVIARETAWDVADPDCPGCHLLAKGLFLEATHELQGHPTIRDARNRWKADLLASQDPANGSWGDDTQNTAYIVMGLTKSSQDQATRTAVAKAVAFLLTVQKPDGGFAVSDGSSVEVTEVDGEVLQALAAAR